MPAITLTIATRRSILATLLDYRFAQRRADLKTKLAELGEEVYRDLYPDHLLMLMAKLPDGYLPKVSYITARFGGTYAQVELGGDRLFGHEHVCTCVRDYGARHPLSARYQELDRQRRKLDEESSTARTAAWAVLKSFRTLGKLLEAWPECAPHVPESVQVPPVTKALAVPVRDLNKLFGLK